MIKKNFSRALLGLTISVPLAFAAVNAAEKGFILDESIHDYSYDASRSMQPSSSRQGQSGHGVRILLDEAYYDYDPALEQAEFAAFEEHSSDRMPKSSSSAIPSVSKTY